MHYSLATDYTPPVIVKNRQLEVHIFRLKLGYKTYSQLTNTPTLCPKCCQITGKQLVHYLSGCQKLRCYYKYPGEDPDNAANNLNHILKNQEILYDLIKKHPPPR